MNSIDKIKDNEYMRLVYVSKLTLQSRLKPSVFKSVEHQSRLFNQKNDITGALCYGNGHFLQCLEGEKKVVMPLWKNILNDNRHKNIRILLLQSIPAPKFNNWAMRLLFLERWLWSPDTKKQANDLSEFLPFKPYGWSSEVTDKFLTVVQKIETPPYTRESGITLNAMGTMIQHMVGPHQAFIVVQGVLSILLILSILMLIYLPLT